MIRPGHHRSAQRRWHARYLDTIPKTMRFREVAYDVKDVIGNTGIGSEGLPT